MIKNLPAVEEIRFDPLVGEIPWRRKWQPTLVFLAGKSHGQRSLAGYSPWGCKELDMTEKLTFHYSGKESEKRIYVCTVYLKLTIL